MAEIIDFNKKKKELKQIKITIKDSDSDLLFDIFEYKEITPAFYDIKKKVDNKIKSVKTFNFSDSIIT